MDAQDYTRIAAALNQARQWCETQNQRRGVERALLTITDALTGQPNFHRGQFLNEARGPLVVADVEGVTQPKYSA